MWIIGWLFKLPALLKGLANFIARTWKLWLGVALIGIIWFAGRWYEERIWLEEAVEREQAILAAVRLAESKLRQEHEAVLVRDRTVREALGRDLTALRQRERILMDEAEVASLVKPIETLKISEGISNDCPKPVLANPFSDDFVRLYNDASGRRPDTGADSTPETD